MYLRNGKNGYSKERLWRWLVVAYRIRQGLCYCILPKSWIPISLSSVRSLLESTMGMVEHNRDAEEYEGNLEEKLYTDN